LVLDQAVEVYLEIVERKNFSHGPSLPSRIGVSQVSCLEMALSLSVAL